jgi:phosphatidylserine/phosphatidylglycerophosphate/cardiolipin synthase-like enzyme
VDVTFYVHPHESGRVDALNELLEEAAQHGSVTTRWWVGGYPSLMHAKFVVADGRSGYFGTANLTSLGLGEHLELGVALAPQQAQDLLRLLEALERAQLFSSERRSR